MARRVRVRGVVEASGAGFAQSRRADGRWDLWRVAVTLRPWRAADGSIETSSLAVGRHTRLPFWLWRQFFRKGRVVEVLVEFADESAGRARLLAWLGWRGDRGLREARTAWLGQQTLGHPAFGRFTFDQRLDWFETKADWLGQRVSLSIGKDGEGRADADVAAQLFRQASEWDAKARDIAADELLETKNEFWLGDTDQPLSRDQFKERMTLESVGVNPGPFVQFYFEDGDLFAGHTIIVTFDEELGESWAEIAG